VSVPYNLLLESGTEVDALHSLTGHYATSLGIDNASSPRTTGVESHPNDVLGRGARALG